MYCNNHNRFLLQFHITGRCNLQCKHCYRAEGNVETLSFEDIINVIEQFKSLQIKHNQNLKIKNKGHINITGGEPFIREDIKEILEYLGENKECFSYGILSNGSSIKDDTIETLKKNKVSFVQLSIDGNKEMHDSLREEGDYERVLNTAANLERSGIRTYISFTANKENYKYLPYVANECRKRKITKLWSDRLVPIGNGQDLKQIVISSEDLEKYIKALKKAQGNIIIRTLCPKTQVTMNRSLQFQNSNGEIYSCNAGRSLITVDEFGNIMPCRRMPIICGNVFETTISDVYYNHKVFKQLRENCLPKECASCKYSYHCRGGARCQSYAEFNSFFKADPACPLKN